MILGLQCLHALSTMLGLMMRRHRADETVTKQFHNNMRLKLQKLFCNCLYKGCLIKIWNVRHFVSYVLSEDQGNNKCTKKI